MFKLLQGRFVPFALISVLALFISACSAGDETATDAEKKDAVESTSEMKEDKPEASEEAAPEEDAEEDTSADDAEEDTDGEETPAEETEEETPAE